MRHRIHLLWVKCVLAVLALPTSLAYGSDDYDSIGHFYAVQSLTNSLERSPELTLADWVWPWP